MAVAIPQVVGTLAANTGPGGHDAGNFACNQAVDAGHVLPVAIPMQEVGKRTGISSDDPRAGIGIGQDGDPMFTLQAGAQHGVAQAVSLRGRNGGGTAELGGDVQNALRASQGGGDKPHVLAQMAVRRLTPRECEALQGFPPDYTAIPWRGKPADQCPDGPRYKALGNFMAVPVMRWIGHRIVAELACASTPSTEDQAA